MPVDKADIEEKCLAVLDRFMAGLNAHDATAMDAAMHFPHVRFAGGTLKIYAEPGNNPMDLFTRLIESDGWSYSRWETTDIVQFSDTKAHCALSYTRFRADGSVIGVYDSLYVLTLIGDRWGIQIRSSFGP